MTDWLEDDEDDDNMSTGSNDSLFGGLGRARARLNASTGDGTGADADGAGNNGGAAGFRMQPQFMGEAGQRLMELQQRIGNDPRFRLDERFAETKGHADEFADGGGDNDNDGAAAPLTTAVLGDGDEHAGVGADALDVSSAALDVPDPKLEGERMRLLQLLGDVLFGGVTETGEVGTRKLSVAAALFMSRTSRKQEPPT